MRKVGVYAGTFDPIHEGHLSFARQALNQCGLDKVFFLVEPRPRRKQGVKALLHRQYMVHLAVVNEPKLGSIMLEQDRFNVADTMPVLQARFKGAQIHMLMGDDVLMHMSQWPHVDELITGVKFIIGVRKRQPKTLERHIETLEKTRGVKFNYVTMPAPNAQISSSGVRTDLRKGLTAVGLMPAVLNYIQAQKLYSSSEKEEA